LKKGEMKGDLKGGSGRVVKGIQGYNPTLKEGKN